MMKKWKEFILYTASNGYNMYYKIADFLCVVIGIFLATVLVDNHYHWTSWLISAMWFIFPSLVLHIAMFIRYCCLSK